MAKKNKEVVEETTTEETVVMEEPVVKSQRIENKSETKKDKWEIRDRLYYLKGKNKPLSYSIRTSNLFWFDEEAGYEREIKYCQNQRTCFVDEMKGDQRLEHVVFRSGSLFVPKEQVTLQKFLSIYHPHKNNLFYEHNPVAIAEDDLDFLEM